MGALLKLAYLGTPEFACRPLEALVAAGHQVDVVVTQPDRRRGRGSSVMHSPVKAAALRLGLDVTDSVEDVRGRGVELGVVVAFGQLIRPHILAEVPMVNLHYSLLPRWRGAAPVERAILAGDQETGVCLMALEEGLDTGAVYDRRVVPIGPIESAASLLERLTAEGTEMLLRSLSSGLAEPVPQQGEATYAKKLTAEDRHVDWIRPAEEIHRLVRVGGAWTTFRGRRLRILAAEPAASAAEDEPGTLDGDALVATAHGTLALVEVQPEGRAPMSARAWINGARLAPGDRLGS